MTTNPRDLIPADVRARLRHLQLVTRRAAGSRGFGLHRSASRGAGLEFAQYRSYEPGDELRQVDWKLYARSDRFFVREAERDSPLDLWLLIDTSASMGQADHARPEQAHPGYSRLEAARAIAACAIELALRQGDRFGIVAVGGRGIDVVPLGTGARHRDRCTLALTALSAHGRWPGDDALRTIWRHVGAQALVLCLSDAFDPALPPLLEGLAAARREVLAIQLLTADERDFPFQGGHRFRDPESGDALLSDGPSVREDFLARFSAAQSALSTRLAASGIRHAVHHTGQPADAPLRALFPATQA